MRNQKSSHFRPNTARIQTFLSRISTVLGVKEHEVRTLLVNHQFKALRINTIRYSGDTALVASELSKLGVATHPLKWYGEALLFDAEDTAKIQDSKLAQHGDIYIQNPSSYLPVLALQPKPEDTILDMCSAPGGKATHIASITGEPQNLTLNEPKIERVEKLQSVLELQGASNAKVIQYDGRHLPELINQQFDKVIIDAECSTEAGTNFLSKDPIKGWSEERILGLNVLQKQLITAGYDLLKPGGVLVYSTCTFAPEENELVVAGLLERRPDAVVQPLKFTHERLTRNLKSWNGKQIPSEVYQSVIRVFPSEYMEGFFLTRIRKPFESKVLNTQLRTTVEIGSRV